MTVIHPRTEKKFASGAFAQTFAATNVEVDNVVYPGDIIGLVCALNSASATR